MNIVEATHRYEAWLARHMPLVRPDGAKTFSTEVARDWRLAERRPLANISRVAALSRFARERLASPPNSA